MGGRGALEFGQHVAAGAVTHRAGLCAGTPGHEEISAPHSPHTYITSSPPRRTRSPRCRVAGVLLLMDTPVSVAVAPELSSPAEAASASPGSFAFTQHSPAASLAYGAPPTQRTNPITAQTRSHEIHRRRRSVRERSSAFLKSANDSSHVAAVRQSGGRAPLLTWAALLVQACGGQTAPQAPNASAHERTPLHNPSRQPSAHPRRLSCPPTGTPTPTPMALGSTIGPPSTAYVSYPVRSFSRDACGFQYQHPPVGRLGRRGAPGPGPPVLHSGPDG